MSYHIYTTEGIILKKSSFGEANILCTILTSDLGLILASAQSARLGVSKLKSSLQEYTQLTVSCIKGKNGWKITNAIYGDNVFFSSEKTAHTCMARITTTLIRMMPGEEANPELFLSVYIALNYLKKVSESDLPAFEILSLLRILYHLGYISKNQTTEEFLQSNEFSETILSEVKNKKIALVGLINNGLKESQL